MSIKSLIIVPVIALFFAAAIQVSASTQHPNQNGREDSDSLEVATVTPAQASDDDCEDEDLKNHGAFVSCIARKHEGGETVSVAARSSVGKKDEDGEQEQEQEDEDDTTASITQTVAPTAAVTVSPTVDPSVTPTPSTTQVESAIAAQLKSLIEELQNLINFLTSLAHD